MKTNILLIPLLIIVGGRIIAQNFLFIKDVKTDNNKFLNIVDYEHNHIQQDTSTFNTDITKNTFFIEYFGMGKYYTINYDRILRIKKQKFSGRIGFGYFPKYPKSNIAAYSVPFEINYLLGRDDNYYEPGIGVSYLYADNFYRNYLTMKNEYSKILYWFIKPAGYRYQPKNSGVFFKVSFLLYYRMELNEEYLNLERNQNIRWPAPSYGTYIGISIGYSF